MNKAFINFAVSYTLRSLMRNKRRTVLTMSTVGFSVAVCLVASSYSEAIMTIWRDGSTDTGISHAQIHAPGYWEKQEGVTKELTLLNGNKVEKIFKADPKVKAFSRRLEFEGIISTPKSNKSIYFVGTGVEPTSEKIISPLLFNPKNDQGTFVNNTQVNGVTIGKGLADTLDLNIGDEATLLSQTITGSVNAVDVIITGIVNVPLPSFSKRAVYTHIRHAQRLLRMPDRYTELAVRLNSISYIKNWAVINTLKSKPFELRPWWVINPIIPKVEIIFNGIIGIIGLLLFISAAISVSNIVYMLVSERTIEIGTLMAIGSKDSEIRRLFTLEAALIGFFGGGLGVVAGNIIILFMNSKGVDFANPFASGTVRVFPSVQPAMSITIYLVAVVICSIAAIIPAIRASKVEPVKAFRGQLG